MRFLVVVDDPGLEAAAADVGPVAVVVDPAREADRRRAQVLAAYRTRVDHLVLVGGGDLRHMWSVPDVEVWHRRLHEGQAHSLGMASSKWRYGIAAVETFDRIASTALLEAAPSLRG